MPRRGRPVLNLTLEERRTRRRAQFVESQRKTRARKTQSVQLSCSGRAKVLTDNISHWTALADSYRCHSPNAESFGEPASSSAHEELRGGIWEAERQQDNPQVTTYSSHGTILDTAAEAVAVSSFLPASQNFLNDWLGVDAYTLPFRIEPSVEFSSLPENLSSNRQLNGSAIHKPPFFDYCSLKYIDTFSSSGSPSSYEELSFDNGFDSSHLLPEHPSNRNSFTGADKLWHEYPIEPMRPTTVSEAAFPGLWDLFGDMS
ncbi:hypothetical protein NQ176_g2939 [Zarea fungicola]|uniref:Uncharacterized protein n=1 Tax=Zarea fungicola TaxID=93591 RepID=A0ACC1NKW0_9HYPO|nr:hypothetical protein NQ176_g2939 [Lecanicillium fungicola]